MARWKDKPQLVALAGTERLAGTSMDGGAKAGGGTVAAEGDIHVTTQQILDAAQESAADAIALAIAALDTVEVITEAIAFTAEPASHAGLRRYVRAGGDVTFDVAEAYESGQVFNLRATGAIELVEDGVTLSPPAGGTLAMTAGMSVTIIMTSGTAGDVVGQVVPA